MHPQRGPNDSPPDTTDMFSLSHNHAEYVLKTHISETHTVNPKNSKPTWSKNLKAWPNPQCVQIMNVSAIVLEPVNCSPRGTINSATEGRELPGPVQHTAYATAHSSPGISQVIKTEFRGEVFQRKYVKMGAMNK